MRKTLIALAAAGILLLGACGDGGDDEEESEGSDTTQPRQSGEHAEFCEALLQGAAEAATGGSGPALPDIEAPPEIAEDWNLTIDAAERMQQIDPNAPDAQAQRDAIQQELGGQERFNEAQTSLQQFIMENCNIPGEEQMSSTTSG